MFPGLYNNDNESFEYKLMGILILMRHNPDVLKPFQIERNTLSNNLRITPTVTTLNKTGHLILPVYPAIEYSETYVRKLSSTQQVQWLVNMSIVGM